MDVDDFLRRYSLSYYKAIERYSKWVESQCVTQRDVLLLALLPVAVLGVLFWLLPKWVSTIIAALLIAPFLYIAWAVFWYYYRGDNRK